ncbi:hypothetical protein F4824DRAFT_462830 [Ustulina deusta]|nr:hypothetical protein F4824DRAFT_462830 [Ustulina deusta]
MECPSCGFALSSSGSDTEGTTRTHDTSVTSYHITLPTWLDQLDQAVKSAWPTRFARYSEVAVLMISWEEAYHGAMEIESRRLASVFRTIYKYSVTVWHIPSTNPDRATSKRINEFLDDYF